MKKIIFASLIAAASSAAFASTTVVISFTGLPATTGNGTTNGSQANTYNGVSTATVAGIPNVSLICDDFNQSTQFPSGPLDYSENTIANLPETAGISGDVDFGGGTVPTVGSVNQVTAYDTAAVLASEIEATPATAGNAQTIANYQYALWYLMEPTGVDGSIKDNPLDTAASADLVAAYKDVEGTGTLSSATVSKIESELIIYTPTSQNPSNQEFIGLTPEPSSWFLMMAAGLFLCIPRVRSRLRVALSSK